MAWKFIPLTVLSGTTACGLLAMRQGRIDAAHDMLDLQERLRAQERRILDTRSELGKMLVLERIRQWCERETAATSVPFVPFEIDDCVPPHEQVWVNAFSPDWRSEVGITAPGSSSP